MKIDSGIVGTELAGLERDVTWRDHVVSEADQPVPQVMIRDVRFKTIFTPASAVTYDLATDPWEKTPHINGGIHAQVLARHRKMLRGYVRKIELCRVPADLAAQIAKARSGELPRHLYPRGNRYKPYCDWYDKIASEDDA